MATNYLNGNAGWQINNANGMAERNQKDATTWQKMIQMLNASRTTDPSTMVGFALGKLLRGSYDHMIGAKNRDAAAKASNEDFGDSYGGYGGGTSAPQYVRVGFDPNNSISIGTTPDRSIAFGQETKTTPTSKMQAYQASAPGVDYASEQYQRVLNNTASNAQLRQGLLGALQKSQQNDPLYYINKIGNPNATFF